MYNYRIIIIMEYVGGGVDYNSGPYTVQFDVGLMRATLNISINDDNIFEDTEMFSIGIDSSSLPNYVTIGNHIRSTVTIIESVGKYVCISKVLYM